MQIDMSAAVRVRLADLLDERKMTQRELAEKTGISENTISKIAGGTPRQLQLETIDSICDVLGIEISDLIVRDKPSAK
jgi:putative transcriptional regulator